MVGLELKGNTEQFGKADSGAGRTVVGRVRAAFSRFARGLVEVEQPEEYRRKAKRQAPPEKNEAGREAELAGRRMLVYDRIWKLVEKAKGEEGRQWRAIVLGMLEVEKQAAGATDSTERQKLYWKLAWLAAELGERVRESGKEGWAEVCAELRKQFVDLAFFEAKARVVGKQRQQGDIP